MISVLDTSVCDNNLGNQIIMDSVDRILRRIFPSEFFIKLPYLDNLGKEAVNYMQAGAVTFLGGTNALSSEMENYKQIGIDHTNAQNIRNIILMGVGWWQYQGAISSYTQQILRHCLHPALYHSVRDSYTKDKLGSIGIHNVLMTGCPTLWSLTEDHCRRIRRSKSENVLLTFTNYSQDKSDLELFNIVQSKYKNIFVWVQGPEDLEYAKQFSDKIHILPPRLDSLDELLASDIDLDYIGTRCHAGIRAMQHLRRSIIIGVDNRAIEMQKDFNLPVLARAKLSSLPKAIDCEFETRLNLPFDTIGRWCRQFSENFNLQVDKPDRQTMQHTAVKPVSRQFGFDRGTPIDRIFIDQFLSQNRDFIRGAVLEIAEDTYTKKFGTGVTSIDILHATAGNPDATIIGNLETGENIPENRYDCIILTQTLHVIYDYRSVIKNCHKALKKDGVLLITAPGISQISRYDMDRWGDYWRFTTLSLKKIFGEHFGEEHVEVRNFGNYQLAVEYLNGRSAEELPAEAFAVTDNDYQLLLGVTAIRKTCAAVTNSSQSNQTQAKISHPCPAIETIASGRTSVSKSPLVLLYHRVAADPIDSQLLAVSPENFEGHLKFLSEHYRVLPLHQLLGQIRQGQLQPDTTAITFDDGYLDNLTNVVPLLEKYGLPATVFVTSGMVGWEGEFWWDALERIFLTGLSLPEFLNISGPQGTSRLDLTSAQNRLKAYDTICGLLRNLPVEEIHKSVGQLLAWARQTPAGRTTHRTVDANQLRILASSPSIEIGSHTVTHTRLSILPPDKQRLEIRQSKQQLESLIRKPVRLFSYPYGSASDFTKETAQILTEEGYEAGIANIQGDITLPVNLYAIPRRLVRNWSAHQFSHWLMDDKKDRLEAQTISGRAQKIVDMLSSLNAPGVAVR